MSFVCSISALAPVRKLPSHTAEMTSQLLFGEFAIYISEENGFYKIKALTDDYEGWCISNQLSIVENENCMSIDSFSNNYTSIAKINSREIHIPFGCPVFSDKIIQISPTVQIDYSNCSNKSLQQFSEPFLNSVCTMYLGTPYLWGGKSVFGIDCSGLVQQVFKWFGIFLPRDAKDQAAKGNVIGFLQEANCGDIAFFDDAEGNIIHTGILLNQHQIIHSFGTVRIDDIDVAGIINTDTKKRTHNLRVIKRMSDTNDL